MDSPHSKTPNLHNKSSDRLSRVFPLYSPIKNWNKSSKALQKSDLEGNSKTLSNSIEENFSQNPTIRVNYEQKVSDSSSIPNHAQCTKAESRKRQNC